MPLTIENEKQNRMSFLDANVWIIQEDKTFTTSVSRTCTLSRVYTHFDSFFPLPICFVLFTQTLIGASEYAQGRLNYTLN